MLDLELDKKEYYDFILTNDDKPFVRNYNDFILFDVDVTKNLTSVSGLTQTNSVLLKNIALNGYDNGLLNYNLLPQYSGLIKINNPYSYTFNGSSYLHNNNSDLGFNSITPLLFEMNMPIMQDPNDKMFIRINDINNNYSLFFLFNYQNDILGRISEISSVINLPYAKDDLISIYMNSNQFYFQINGETKHKYTNTGTTINDYRFEIGLISNSSYKYTINELRMYGQKSVYTGVTHNISGLTMPVTGITYTNNKTKFKFYPVTGYTKNTKYNILGGNDYNQLDGGFYQGVFKYYDEPIEYAPSRMNRGFTVNLLLHYPISGTTNNLKLNTVYSGNTGFVYYMGTRSETKYSQLTPKLVTLLTKYFDFTFENYPTYFMNITGSTTGVTNSAAYRVLNEELAFEDLVFGEYFGAVDTYGAYYLYYEGNPYFSESLYYLTSNGVITGNSNNATISHGNMLYTDKYFDQQFLFTSGVTFAGRSLGLNNKPYTGYFNVASGMTYLGRSYSSTPTGLTYYETYKDIINNSFGVRITPDGRIGYRNIYATDNCYTGSTQEVSGISNNSFIDMTSDCDLFTKGKIITKYFTIEESYTKESILNQYIDSKYIYISIIFNRNFNYDTECQLEYLTYNKGTLVILVNGFQVYKNTNFIEPIPHKLDTDYRVQEAVPYNISFGGGTQGLYDSIFIDTGTTKDGILQKFFAGTFEGGVKGIQMYSVPLYNTEIRSIISNKLQQYNLFYPKGGRRIFIKNKF